MNTTLYLHDEEAPTPSTLKLVCAGAIPVHEALAKFATAHAASGGMKQRPSPTLRTDEGRLLARSALLPCGLAHASDLFVCDGPPVDAAAEAAATAAAAAPPRTVYAQEGSAIAASQARAGENSYYYSVGKNRAAGGAADPAPPPKPRAVAAAPSRLPEATIPSYSMVDDGALCKVLIPFAGAGALAAGALTVDFRDRSFDLRAVSDGKVWRLHVPLLHEEINQHECGCRVRPGKLIVRLAKRDGSKGWYELRKTKGVGDTEWHKLVPDAGESVVVTI